MPVKNTIINSVKNDRHFLLLIIFFATHGYAEYLSLVPLQELLLVTAILAAAALLLFVLFRRIFKGPRKAALFVTFLSGIFLFFGVIQDFLGQFRITSALAQLRVLAPLSLAAVVAAFIALKASRRRLERPTIFLNVLLLLYIMVDAATIAIKTVSPLAEGKTELAEFGLDINACDTCARPPVYLVLLDEYSGSDALKGYFNYDNAPFEQFLRQEGFHVAANTTSNYIFTVFSMAGTLHMDYLRDIGEQSAANHFGYRKATGLISTNPVARFFRAKGYSIHNYSYFQLPASPPRFKTDYLPGELSLITRKTMYSIIAKELVRVLANKYAMGYFLQKSDETYLRNNEAMMRLALEQASARPAQPSFTYLHLMLPHDPIAYDSTGRRITPFWKRKSYSKKEMDDAYLQYLAYANSRMRSFLHELKQRTNGEAVIVLMSDHGYRGSKTGSNTRWTFSTLNAVYLPRQNYRAWYDGMSNVNQFRALLNSAFGQRLPMLKDSLVR